MFVTATIYDTISSAPQINMWYDWQDAWDAFFLAACRSRPVTVRHTSNLKFARWTPEKGFEISEI